VAVAVHRPASSQAAPFTKGEVNRAGVLLLDLRERMRRNATERAVADSEEQKLDKAWEVLTWWRSLHARPLSAVAANLRYHVDRSDARVRARIEVTQRLKRLDTLIGKLGRERGNVTQMQDIGGVRAVVPSLRHVYVVRRRLLKSWGIIRERDYIAEPKSSGYRALHLIVGRMGYPIEVQLRTIGQDVWANQVEETGRQVGLDLKFGARHERLDSIFLEVAELIARFDRAELSPHDLREGLKRVPSLPIGEAREDDANEPG
jgi:putative GTP pyrophosphokinase